MHNFQQSHGQASEEWHAGDALPIVTTTEQIVPPEVEDARRRFLLALRVVTARKMREEKDAAARIEWMRTLEADVEAYKRWKWRKTRRQIFMTCMVLMMLFGKHI